MQSFDKLCHIDETIFKGKTCFRNVAKLNIKLYNILYIMDVRGPKTQSP